MLSPSESRTKRIARLVILTHAVPAIASTNGSATSDATISATPIHLAAGWSRRMAGRGLFKRDPLCPVADTFAEQPLRPEDQHQDQHDERVDVLVVAAEHARVGARLADLGEARQEVV